MIRITGLNVDLKRFRLRDIHLTVAENDFFILMGPTGAGKTVLLEAVAGLVPLASGEVFLRDRAVTTLPPEKRGIGIVYQDHALFPHLNVSENIRYGLRFQRPDGDDPRRRFERLVDLLSLTHLLDRLPARLSGGEKQRVALARSLVVNPAVVLLDEPLSALDPGFKEEVRQALKRLHRSAGVTFLMVTHDFADALSLATRAAVIHQGRIEQEGSARDIFQRPCSPFVARFVGIKNLFEARFSEGSAIVGDLRIELERTPGQPRGYLAIRPEEVAISRGTPPPGRRNALKGRVSGLLDRGFYDEVSVEVQGVVFTALLVKKSLAATKIEEGEGVFLAFDPETVHVI